MPRVEGRRVEGVESIERGGDYTVVYGEGGKSMESKKAEGYF